MPLPNERRWRGLEPPPWALVAILGSILFAILAAAGPIIYGWRGMGQTITLVVDRGLTMSATDRAGQPRFVQAAELAQAAIQMTFPGASIQIRSVPGDGTPVSAGRNWLDNLRQISGCAMVDPQSVAVAAEQSITETRGPVLVLSDQFLEVSDARLIQIEPTMPLDDVGIESLTLCAQPHVQAMVRVANRSPESRCRLIVRAGGKEINQEINLPKPGESGNYFVDLPGSAAAGEVVEADIRAGDGTALNHQAWAVRRAAWPRVEASGPLPKDLQRMIDVYGRHRPPKAGSNRVIVTAGAGLLPEETVGAILAPNGADDSTLDADNLYPLCKGPLFTDAVDWAPDLQGATVSALPAGDWQPVVLASGLPVVAVRTSPARQVWIGFHSADFPTTVDFVVFWSEVFDWLGQTGLAYEDAPVHPLSGDWVLKSPAGATPPPDLLGFVPGLYQQPDGGIEAINAPPMGPSVASNDQWRLKFARLADDLGRGGIVLDKSLTVAAAALACLAAVLWQSKSSHDRRHAEPAPIFADEPLRGPTPPRPIRKPPGTPDRPPHHPPTRQPPIRGKS
jgi:hypothetical protein